MTDGRHPVDAALVHYGPKTSGGETSEPTSVDNDGQELQAAPTAAPTLRVKQDGNISGTSGIEIEQEKETESSGEMPATGTTRQRKPKIPQEQLLQLQRRVMIDTKQVAQAANAILVGAALVATVTYAGWLFLPFSNIRHGHHFATKVFWVSNSFSFFSAIVTVWLCVVTVWPFTADLPICLELVEMRLKYALFSFAFSFASVVTAYSSGGYVVVTKDLDFIITHGLMLGTIIAGAVLCGLTILLSLCLGIFR